MSARTFIADVSKHEGKEVEIRGWIYQTRSSGKLLFLVLRDGTGYCQTVIGKKDCDEATWEAFSKAGLESSVIVTGVPRPEPRAPGGWELGFKSGRVFQSVSDWPLQKKEHGPDFLMDHRHLWLRASRQVAILRIRNELSFGLRDFFYRRGFVNIDSPIITPAACEGTSTLFGIDYHGLPAYLSQSGQLYIEPACIAHGKVFCFGPTFRAEKSKTRRHLHEFWMLEPEIAWAELDDLMQLAEEMLVDVVARVLDKCKAEFKTLERDTAPLEKIKGPFPRVRYVDAVNQINAKIDAFNGQFVNAAKQDAAGAEKGEFTHEFLKMLVDEYKVDQGHLAAMARKILKGDASELPFERASTGDDLGSTHETILTKMHDRPVMVHRYPAAVKAFYMQPDEDDPSYAKCVDVLAPEGYGEIIGGSQRIHDLDLMRKRIREHHLPEEAFQWYLETRKYGTVPHGGFGLGLERLVAWVCKLDHVRETIPYARMLNRVYP